MLYLLLAATGIAMLLILWRERVDPGQLGLLLITGAAVGTADLIFKGLLHVYSFQPGLLEESLDGYLGVILAELIFVAAAFASLAGFLVGNVALVGSLVALEYLFVMGGLFIHKGWELWMTLMVFTIYAWGLTRWLRSFERRGYDPTHRAILVVAIVTYAWHLWALLLHRLIRSLDLTLPPLLAIEPNQVLGSTLLHGVPAIVIGIAAVGHRWAERPGWLFGLVGLFTTWLYLLSWIGPLEQAAPWSIPAEGIMFGLVLAGSMAVDRWLERVRVLGSGV